MFKRYIQMIQILGLSLINCQSFIINYLFGCFYQNISFTLLLLQLLLLGNDVAENPGPETKVGEVSVFHWNSRSIRHKFDHLQTISNDSSIICVTESHLSPVYTMQVLHPSLHSSFLNSSFLIVYTIQET